MGDVDAGVVPVICGPTGSGKSELAIRLAMHSPIPVTIVSADSRQIYRGLDIGTAKPTRAEQQLVPHRGLDIVAPIARYSAAAWASDAGRWIDEAHAKGRRALVVGGTGLYLRALFDPLFEEPALPSEGRRAVESYLATMPVVELARWVRVLDPERANLGRTQLLRAIEIALLTGRRLSALHREHARPARRTARYLVVDPGTALGDRLATRLDTMLSGGWVDEVLKLIASVPDDAPAWKASGYRVVRQLARGEIDVSAAREAILIETRQYAKRQRTWFRHQLPASAVTHLDPLARDAHERAERWWSALAAPEGVAS